MRIAISVRVALLLCFSAVSIGAWAQGEAFQHGRVLVPDSTIEHPEDVGRRAHTNHVIFLRSSGLKLTVPSGETPASLGCVYGLSSGATGCPKVNAAGPSRGSQTIAIVDAYHYASAYNDLTVFSNTFKLFVLPQCSATVTMGCFAQVFAKGSQPKTNCGWAQEAALDIEWAHAMAPNAKIVLVEAASNSNADLFAAVDVATNEVICGSRTCPYGTGEGEVSMSWGSSEFSSEKSFDSHFPVGNGVVYFASSGDSGGKVIYPSASPYVVSAGGTTVNRSGGNFTTETAWSGSGGGPSKYEGRPTSGYQDVIQPIVGGSRGTPDFSFDANPSTGVSVYDSTSCQGLSGWLVFGGTSVSSPSLAGIVNLAGHFAIDSGTELGTIYADYSSSTYPKDYRDITSGTAGSFSAKAGWDFVTGVGSDIGTSGK
jgi:subtilase family serine protease